MLYVWKFQSREDWKSNDAELLFLLQVVHLMEHWKRLLGKPVPSIVHTDTVLHMETFYAVLPFH